jgi:hypothetical protein
VREDAPGHALAVSLPVGAVLGAAAAIVAPGAVHEERRDLLIVGSRFVQPCGAWSGRLTVPGRPPIVIDHALGVTEDQDVTW